MLARKVHNTSIRMDPKAHSWIGLTESWYISKLATLAGKQINLLFMHCIIKGITAKCCLYGICNQYLQQLNAIPSSIFPGTCRLIIPFLTETHVCSFCAYGSSLVEGGWYCIFRCCAIVSAALWRPCSWLTDLMHVGQPPAPGTVQLARARALMSRGIWTWASFWSLLRGLLLGYWLGDLISKASLSHNPLLDPASFLDCWPYTSTASQNCCYKSFWPVSARNHGFTFDPYA